jgi:hypothetical protein
MRSKNGEVNLRKLIIATSILCIATTAHAGPRSGSLIDLLGTIQTLEACGVDLYLDQQTIDTTTPAGKLPTAIYRKLISEEAAPFLGLAVDLVRRAFSCVTAISWPIRRFRWP